MGLALGFLLIGLAFGLLALGFGERFLVLLFALVFGGAASCSAIAIACLRFFTLPALPSGPLFNSPCANSCMTRPTTFFCFGDSLGMVALLYNPDKTCNTLDLFQPVIARSPCDEAT